MHDAAAKAAQPHPIRDALAQVQALRSLALSDPSWADAVRAVKQLQARRFAASYADMLQGGTYAQAAQFFMDEIYSERDYSERDAQFGRIATAIERYFPQRVGATALALAQLHALTEQLDYAMGQAWTRAGTLGLTASPGARYLWAWREVGRHADRQQQLDAVMHLGQEMIALTRTPGLRTVLRMMRAPAHAAGLGALQLFLERGFDTFAALARNGQAAQTFLSIVQERESALISAWFDDDLQSSQARLAALLQTAGA